MVSGAHHILLTAYCFNGKTGAASVIYHLISPLSQGMSFELSVIGSVIKGFYNLLIIIITIDQVTKEALYGDTLCFSRFSRF